MSHWVIRRSIAAKPGWFVPVGELLDHLRARRDERDGLLPRAEWRRMQWRWMADLVSRKVAARREQRGAA